MKVALIFAMRAEAQPLIDYYGLEEQEGFFSPLPCKLYRPSSKLPSLNREGVGVSLILNGVDHDRDLIGCEAAAVTTQAAIIKLQPDLVISCGTCGGWQRYGARVGQAYVADAVMFHDRRVPGDNAWDTQGLGNYKVWEGSWQVAEALALPMGKVTTGSSFDLTAEEDALIDKHGGRLKEMEGAAVAFVCSLYHVPVMLIKAVTNLRDVAEDEQIDNFQANMKQASDSLLKAVKGTLDFLLD
ncbi:MAG: hypothetical protein IJV10_05815 [Prevotella sp.]|nr:hypothetical protein [Prevotella sp.]